MPFPKEAERLKCDREHGTCERKRGCILGEREAGKKESSANCTHSREFSKTSSTHLVTVVSLPAVMALKQKENHVQSAEISESKFYGENSSDTRQFTSRKIFRDGLQIPCLLNIKSKEMLSRTKHVDAVQFSTLLVHDESRQHWDLFLETQWLARSLVCVRKIMRERRKTANVFHRGMRDVFPSNARYDASRDIGANIPSRQLNKRKNSFLRCKSGRKKF